MAAEKKSSEWQVDRKPFPTRAAAAAYATRICISAEQQKTAIVRHGRDGWIILLRHGGAVINEKLSTL
jgi:hypothetical protein